MRTQSALVVIGASGGIGSTVVRQAVARSIPVIGVDVGPAVLSSELYVHCVKDFSDGDAPADIAAFCAGRAMGSIVNVSGGATSEEVGLVDPYELDDDTVERTLSSNFRTSLNSLRLARRLFGKTPPLQDRSVTLCSSINAIGTYGYPVYSASKGAIESLALSAARQFGAIGTRVNCIRLGTVVTETSRHLHGESESGHYERLRQLSPLGRFVLVDEAAASILALAVDLTGATGIVLTIDAGQSVPGVR